MNSKKANWLFLSVILLHIVVSVLVTVMSRFFSLHIILNLLLSELLLLIPALFVLWRTEGSLPEKLGLKRIRISTVLMTILFTYLTMPLIVFVNLISMIFVDNQVMELSPQILNAPFPVIFFLMAVYGPFCEETVFRGVIYGSYRRDGKGIAAVILSGLLFGLMHMNFNQAAYAFVIGILLALLVEATGSLWSSVLYHFIVNAQSVCLMYLMKSVAPSALEGAQQGLNLSVIMLFLVLAFYFLLAVAFTTLAVLLLLAIARNEKREQIFYGIFRKKRSAEGATEVHKKAERRILTVPAVAGIVLCLGVMVLEVVIS
ncbi:MAG: CPBP family intramembrane metalloprotease [Clostridiales bacterium]|nr:CPBP family intramembrane metalloprotease [Clostridiales bacterium]